MQPIDSLRAKGRVRCSTLVACLVGGVIGGLAGTIVLDITQVGMALGLGYSADLTYYVGGITTAGVLGMLGIKAVPGVLLGVIMRYLIGVGLGAILGAVVSQVHALQVDRVKCALFSLVFVQALSQPLLASAPFIMKATWTVDETWQWFVVSFFIHTMYGLVLALVVSHGLRVATRAESDDLVGNRLAYVLPPEGDRA